jgi:predicted PurR-regulated permease PerM
MQPPTDKQARLIWFSLSAACVALLAALIGIVLWGLGVVVSKLSIVLLPLAVAGVAAYLLDPVVEFFIKRRVPRTRAILLVFALVSVLFIGLWGTVAPQLVDETQDLASQAPAYASKLNQKVSGLLDTPWMRKMLQKSHTGEGTDSSAMVESWLTETLPSVGSWAQSQMSRLASWAGLALSLFLAPVYTFYFLLERDRIEGGWRKYLPIKSQRIRNEVIFIISSINDSLIVFFRGQVLVSLCSGTLLTLAFLAIGLDYALFMGAMAAILGIIPYLGFAMSFIPAVGLAAVQFQDWQHPLMIAAAFVLVNLNESFIVSPKIIGDRVGLHPLAIMIAMMVGTSLMGGILGGLLAIPLTAALRSILQRYVWNDSAKSRR